MARPRPREHDSWSPHPKSWPAAGRHSPHARQQGRRAAFERRRHDRRGPDARPRRAGSDCGRVQFHASHHPVRQFRPSVRPTPTSLLGTQDDSATSSATPSGLPSVLEPCWPSGGSLCRSCSQLCYEVSMCSRSPSCWSASRRASQPAASEHPPRRGADGRVQRRRVDHGNRRLRRTRCRPRDPLVRRARCDHPDGLGERRRQLRVRLCSTPSPTDPGADRTSRLCA